MKCLRYLTLVGMVLLLASISFAADSATKDYINGWTFPTPDDSAKPTNSVKSTGSRERMLTNDTDNYKRAWTFPAAEKGTSDKSSGLAEPHSDSPKVPPPDDTEEYLNGWTFE